MEIFNKKNLSLIILFILFASIIFAGCIEGERGRIGVKGEDGEDGKDGEVVYVNCGETLCIMNQTINLTPNLTAGINGINGIDGINGESATIEINYTFTLPSGSSASVVNIGDALNALLDFGIPSGNSTLENTSYTDSVNASMKIYVDNTNSTMKTYIDNTNSTMKIYVDNINSTMKTYVDNTNSTMKTYVDNSNSTMKTYVDATNASILSYVNSNLTLWTTWSPTLVWSNNTPVSVAINARYNKIGNIVFITGTISSDDSNGANGLTITLPISAKETNMYIELYAVERYGTNGELYGNPYAVIVATAANRDKILFHTFYPATDGKRVWILFNGQYEV